MSTSKNTRSLLVLLFLFYGGFAAADLTRLEVKSRETLQDAAVNFTYERVQGIAYFTLDPADPANASIVDLQHAPRNQEGLVEYAADFRMLIPDASITNGGLLYHVNNRGGSEVPPESALTHPLSELGFTYLVTGWINEMSAAENLVLLHAPIVGSSAEPITGEVRYEIIVGEQSNDVNIAGGGHLAYTPTETGARDATLTHRLYPHDARVPVERSQFRLDVQTAAGRNQPLITLNLDGGFEPGRIYELKYEAQDSVLAGAGMAGIRDMVSMIRYDGDSAVLEPLNLPTVTNTVAWGNSQSGRLLRQFMYDGLNADSDGRIVFDGIIPVIAGSGFGMFNNRFAMPTRTNGQESNQLYPNDLFPFTYGDSTDPFTCRTDGILKKARESNALPKVMHIQTSNEYWLRGGSLPHTNPQGTEDAVLPEEVRFYTIGGSQHGSGNGKPRSATSTQLPPNPNMWSPIADSLLVAMYDWIAKGIEPPASRYPKISDGTLLASHVNGRINRSVWKPLNGVTHPEHIYVVGFANWGDRWWQERIIDQHPTGTDQYYNPLVPAVNSDNNDLPESTILPPLTQVPLATFVPWNLRSPEAGAPKSLARLSGGYIPFPPNTAAAVQSRDSRNSIAGLYSSFDDYLQKYEAATDKLIAEGYLLPGFKETLMAIARGNNGVFE